MKSKAKNKIIKEILGTFTLVIAVIIIFRYDDIKGGFFPESLNLKQTSGIITTSETNYHVGVKGVAGHRFIIKYKYEANGKNLTSDKINFGKKSFRSKEKAEEVIKKYPIGKEVVVYYEIDNPSFAILEPKVNYNSEFLIVLAVLGSFILFLLVIIFQRFRKKRPQTKLIKSKK